jgi:hypothetical protein
MSRVPLRTNLYIIREDQVFVANVLITNLTWETTTLNVINQPTNVATKLRALVNIRNYRGLHEGHHFIQMVMEVHNALRQNMDRFIKKCAYLFHDR